jgi:hypothetical protein
LTQAVVPKIQAGHGAALWLLQRSCKHFQGPIVYVVVAQQQRCQLLHVRQCLRQCSHLLPACQCVVEVEGHWVQLWWLLLVPAAAAVRKRQQCGS